MPTTEPEVDEDDGGGCNCSSVIFCIRETRSFAFPSLEDNENGNIGVWVADGNAVGIVGCGGGPIAGCCKAWTTVSGGLGAAT